jgi:hypothetical protein
VRLILAAVLLLTSCGSSVPTGAGPSAPAASPYTTSVASTTRGASPTPSPAVSTLGDCRLPVASQAGVGWLDVPGGTFKPDPTSIGHISPIDSSIAWDPAISGWVPTDPRSLSPDGARYVAPDTSAAISIVDARSGSTIAAIPPHYQSDLGVFAVIGYTTTAIFLVQTGKNPQPGVWKISTSTWALSQVTSNGPGTAWTLVDGSIIWGTRASATAYGGIDRLDAYTGVVQEVLAPSHTDTELGIAGLAGSGVLVVNVPGRLSSAELVNSDGSSLPVGIPSPIMGSLLGPSFQDEAETLMVSSVGLVSYDRNYGFQLLVSRSDLYQILGKCATA